MVYNSIASHTYYEKHKRDIKIKNNIRSKTSKQRFVLAKSSAVSRGKVWELTLDQYEKLINQPCCYCQDRMCAPVVYGKGLDRIDNLIGYIIENVQPCCTACNLIRGTTLTVAETHAAIQAVLLLREKLKI
jgi:hypothetical protein